MGFPGGSDSKESACNAGDQVQSLGQEDPLEKGMVTHSSILAWRIPWIEEPGELQTIGSQRVRHDWATNTHTHTHTHSVHTFCGPVSCIRPLHGAEMTFLGGLPSYPLKLRFYIFRLALFLTSSSKFSEKGSDWFATDQVSTINQSTVARIADLDPLGSTSPWFRQ